MDAKHILQYKILGSNIARIRKEKKYTQSMLAGALGVNRTHIARVETAQIGISLDLIYEISKLLEVDVYKFFVCEG